MCDEKLTDKKLLGNEEVSLRKKQRRLCAVKNLAQILSKTSESLEENQFWTIISDKMEEVVGDTCRVPQEKEKKE